MGRIDAVKEKIKQAEGEKGALHFALNTYRYIRKKYWHIRKKPSIQRGTFMMPDYGECQERKSFGTFTGTTNGVTYGMKPLPATFIPALAHMPMSS